MSRANPKQNSEHKYYNAFNLIPQMGPMRFKKLCAHFDCLENAWHAQTSELEKAGLEKDIVGKIIEVRKKISPEEEFEKLEKEKIKLVAIKDDLYPSKLKEIHSAPAVLYFKGEIKKEELAIAIIGARKVSGYGAQVASHFAREMARAGLAIVSGMALGIDSYAHRECLKLKKRTLAILGGGLDKNSIYPASSQKLACEICENGALISEYPIGTPPLKQHFPARNRIISGLSLGVLVIEASENSGALITANFALEQNREVFAIPGNIIFKKFRRDE